MSEVIDLVSPPKSFSEIIDLVTPTKPRALCSALPSPAASAESLTKREVDCCDDKPRKRRKPRKQLVCPPSQPDSDDDNGWVVDEWQDVIVNLQSTTARKVSFDDIAGASLKEESSFDHPTAGASLKEESSYGYASYDIAGASLKEESSYGFATDETPSPVSAQGISKWVCDVCKVKWFLDYREACEREESYGKVGNARNGGGGLSPPPSPLSSRASSMSTTVASRVVAANASTTEESHSLPKRKKSWPLEPRTTEESRLKLTVLVCCPAAPFDEEAFRVATAPATSVAYSAAVATATEESSEDDDIHSHSAFIVGGECSGDTVKTSNFKINSDSPQLYPNGEWLSCIVPQEHDSGVLTAYALLFYTFLSSASITSHVAGLNNVTHVDKLLPLNDFGTQFLGGFLPGWLNLIFDPNFGWNSFTTAVLDSLVRESKKALSLFDNKRGREYMKATHRQKKWWFPKISICLANSNHPSVILFCRRVLANLVSMHDDDWYTVLYCGETITTFNQRMCLKDPRWFLDWFPATHIFSIAAFQYSGPWNESNKTLLTGATRALEAGNAAWLNHKLPGLDDGHSYNIAPCGHRFYPTNLMMPSFVYVSFEMIEGMLCSFFY